MERDKIILGGVLVTLLVCGIVAVSQYGSVTEIPPIVEEEETRTELEILTDEIMQSEEFVNETRLRAIARAKYQLAQTKQSEAVTLSEEALSTYRMAMELENEWKVNQTVVTE